MPDLAVTTDIIVGFPGETDDDFERTLEVVAEAGYDSAYTFIYSPRPGTEAAERPDDFVPAEVTAERFARLTAVVERSARLRHEARVGRIEEVVVEGRSRRDPAEATGRTRQNKLVHFPAEPMRPGTLRHRPGDRRRAAPPAGRAGRASPPRPGTAPASRSRPRRNAVAMATWSTFEAAAPELATAGQRLLYQFGPGLGFLATVRPDGGPRLHPICPVVAEGELWAFILRRSPKCRDLERDGRYALHSFPPVEKDDEFAVTGTGPTGGRRRRPRPRVDGRPPARRSARTTRCCSRSTSRPPSWRSTRRRGVFPPAYARWSDPDV